MNCAPTSAGAGAVTVNAAPPLEAALIALMPAALSASCVLVTTSTFGGSAGAARFWPADAVTGSTNITARLATARPEP